MVELRGLNIYVHLCVFDLEEFGFDIRFDIRNVMDRDTGLVIWQRKQIKFQTRERNSVAQRKATYQSKSPFLV